MNTILMVVALSRGMPVRFKSARVLLVASEDRTLVHTLERMGIADICCVSEMAAARALCDAGGVDVCLAVLPQAIPDDKPDWDAGTDAPGRGRVPSLLIAQAATPYIRRAATSAGYYAVIPFALSGRMLYRCIGALLQAARRPRSVAREGARQPRTRGMGPRSPRGEPAAPGKLKLQ